jgi:hypothetical protein
MDEQTKAKVERMIDMVLAEELQVLATKLVTKVGKRLHIMNITTNEDLKMAFGIAYEKTKDFMLGIGARVDAVNNEIGDE